MDLFMTTQYPAKRHLLQHAASTLMLSMVLAIPLFVGGCETKTRIMPGTTPRNYPYAESILGTIDIQVFREDTQIELVNHTAYSYDEFDLWLNERYVRRVNHLGAGDRLQISLFEFIDENSEGLRAGGLLTTGTPDPIVKAEIETTEGLVGLITIPDRKR